MTPQNDQPAVEIQPDALRNENAELKRMLDEERSSFNDLCESQFQSYKERAEASEQRATRAEAALAHVQTLVEEAHTTVSDTLAEEDCTCNVGEGVCAYCNNWSHFDKLMRDAADPTISGSSITKRLEAVDTLHFYAEMFYRDYHLQEDPECMKELKAALQAYQEVKSGGQG